MKNSKENKKRSTTLTSSKEYITRARHEASSSKDYIAEQRIDKYCSKNENRLVNDKHIICSNDDVKENLDPVKSKTHNDTFNNSTLMNADNTMTLNDYVCENDNEKRFISNDTNLCTFNPRIYNTNTDVTDVQSVHNQISQTNFENVQQISLSNVIPESKEGTVNDDQSFCKKTDKIECSVNLDDLNIVTMNKRVKKVLLDDITFFTNKHVDDNKEIRYDCIDDHLGLLNGKHFNNIDVIIPKVQNRGAIAKVTRNKYNILNKQIGKCNAGNFIQCTTFHENIENYNSKNNIKSNVKSCFKISIDLCKIQNLIDTKPELFIKQNHDDNNQWHKNINYLYSRNDHTQEQVRYNIKNSNDNYNITTLKQMNCKCQVNSISSSEKMQI